MNKRLRHTGVLGMKWGVRRYQNSDGTLTAAGKKRYAKDKSTNESKKAKDRADDSYLKDPHRWVREDLRSTKSITDSGAAIVRTAKEIESKSRPTSKSQKTDLSQIDDATLRQKINRLQMEKQYHELTNPKEEPKISKGRAFLKNTLDAAGSVLSVGSSIISIATAIKDITG